MNFLIQELLRRQLPFPLSFYESVNLRSATPKLIVQAFHHFIEVPTFEVACEFVDCFKKRPPLHLVCANLAIQAGGRTVLGIIGRAIRKAFPLPFPFDLFFHQAVAEVAKEVERTRGKLRDGDVASLGRALRSIPRGFLRLLLPLLFEFPELLGIVEQMPELASAICPIIETAG
jgi:hypothetical protein